MVLTFVMSIMFGSQAFAKIAGKNVVFISGLQPTAFLYTILNDPNKDAKLREEARAQLGEVMRPIADYFIYFDSSKRLSANSYSLYKQVKNFERTGVCNAGCIFVTASTGDLVTRYISNNIGLNSHTQSNIAGNWRIDKTKFRILATLDTVGAGGGTEGADVIIALAEGNSIAQFISKALTAIFFGSEYGERVDFARIGGIIHDLRPSMARTHVSQDSRIPKLRYVAATNVPVLNQILWGEDDGVVPLHSACGAKTQRKIDSCSNSITLDGQLRSVNGPSSSDLLKNYYPLTMAKNMFHTDVDFSGQLVAVNNNRNFGPMNMSISERKYSTGWWIFKNHYRVVNKPNGTHALQFLAKELNN